MSKVVEVLPIPEKFNKTDFNATVVNRLLEVIKQCTENPIVRKLRICPANRKQSKTLEIKKIFSVLKSQSFSKKWKNMKISNEYGNSDDVIVMKRDAEPKPVSYDEDVDIFSTPSTVENDKTSEDGQKIKLEAKELLGFLKNEVFHKIYEISNIIHLGITMEYVDKEDTPIFISDDAKAMTSEIQEMYPGITIDVDDSYFDKDVNVYFWAVRTDMESNSESNSESESDSDSDSDDEACSSLKGYMMETMAPAIVKADMKKMISDNLESKQKLSPPPSGKDLYARLERAMCVVSSLSSSDETISDNRTAFRIGKTTVMVMNLQKTDLTDSYCCVLPYSGKVIKLKIVKAITLDDIKMSTKIGFDVESIRIYILSPVDDTVFVDYFPIDEFQNVIGTPIIQNKIVASGFGRERFITVISTGEGLVSYQVTLQVFENERKELLTKYGGNEDKLNENVIFRNYFEMDLDDTKGIIMNYMEKKCLESILDDKTENDILVYTGKAGCGFGGTPIIDTKTERIVGFHWGKEQDYLVAIKAKTVVDAILKELKKSLNFKLPLDC